MSLAMQFFTIGMLVMIVLTSSDADRNARAAHRHAHELACAVGAVDLCKFHEATK